MGNLRDLQAKSPRPQHKPFRACAPGYLQVDVKYLPQMADESSRRTLFVAIDRATRRVFVRVCKSKTTANARRFLRDLERACPIRIRTILTERAMSAIDPRDNGEGPRIYRSPVRIAQTRGNRKARVRSTLHRPRHLTPPVATDAPANQRHGRAV